MTPLLETQALEVSYGQIPACREISISVNEGEIVTLIGANGAGKTTTLRAIAGALRLRSGAIRFAAKDITALPSHERTNLGIALVPEGRRVFPFLTVRENLELGAFKYRKEHARVRGRMDAMFDMFPRLRERAGQTAGTLSGGERQMLALGRALMSEPKLLMLDEPSLGLAPTVVEQLYDTLFQLHRDGLTLLLAEQSIPLALGIADYAYVLQTGRIAVEGKAADLERNEQVQEIYLGVKTSIAGAIH